jgi:hypothetical protein
MPTPDPAYRIFISYSHQDDKLVRRLDRVLRENKLTPMRDKNFAYGVGFHDQIKRFIESAHVFMPVITGQSSERVWVHQEIGYVMSQNVPVLPVAIDWQPGEWLQTLHSVMLTRKDVLDRPNKLKTIFSRALFRDLINRFRDDRFANFSCGFLQEDRTAMMIEYANHVEATQTLLSDMIPSDDPESVLSSVVRQKGGLSSFHIPNEPVSAKVWKDRYGDRPRPEHHCRLQREERRALTRHAVRWGCRLIINPSLPYADQGVNARRVRIECLLRFLESADAQKAQVAISTEMSRSENVTIVGNWFLALAVAVVSGRGYYQTIFTRHAPSMQAKIEEFDDEFHRLLDERGWEPENSRLHAITEIRNLLEKLSAVSKLPDELPVSSTFALFRVLKTGLRE